jgi:hypothetical protein
MEDTLTIPWRFRGPPASGNGGYSCGALAAFVPGVAEITLKKPPPLDHELTVHCSEGRARLNDGSEVVAEARPAELVLEIPGAPPYEVAEAESRHYAGFTEHPFPECFVCGTARASDDGLRIFAGRSRSDGVVAAPWVPTRSFCNEQGTVRPEILWAALDCPGYFAIEERGPALLGRMTARLSGEVRLGERSVVIGWSLGREGRKIHTATALFGESGSLVGACRQIWIALS